MSAWPLAALAMAYVLVYVFPIFAYPVTPRLATGCHAIEYLIWGVFVVDYVFQLMLAGNKKEFLRKEWLSMLFVAFPFFRPIRVLRAVIILRQATSRPQNTVLSSMPWVIAMLGPLMMLISAAAELNVERFAPGSNIHSVGDALWWSLVTMTTIGYGDKYPVTTEGRLIAAVLIIFGIGIVASLTGYFASWMFKQASSVHQEG